MKTVAWAGVNTDGSPALGQLVVRYRGSVLLEDGATPVSVYPAKIVKPLTAHDLTVNGNTVSVGWCQFQLPASNDPAYFGSGGIYVIHEDLESGEGVDRFGPLDIGATGTTWLNKFSVLETDDVSQPVNVTSGEIVTQDYTDTGRRPVPIGARLMILGGTAAQKPAWALPGDLYAAVSG